MSPSHSTQLGHVTCSGRSLPHVWDVFLPARAPKGSSPRWRGRRPGARPGKPSVPAGS